MRFFNFKPQTIPSPAEALPGRSDPIMKPGIHRVLGTPLAGPWPDGHEDRGLRPRLLLGRREGLLAAPRRRDDGRRLCRWPHPEPDLRGGLLRADRSRRGRAGRLRPVEDLVRAAAQDLLGASRPDPGHAPGQRPRHQLPLDHHRRRRRAAGRGRGLEGDVPEANCRPPATARSRPRSSTPRRTRSTTPRTTTSSTSTRTRAATARTTRPA